MGPRETPASAVLFLDPARGVGERNRDLPDRGAMPWHRVAHLRESVARLAGLLSGALGIRGQSLEEGRFSGEAALAGERVQLPPRR
jgi:hypothetical protein